MELEKTKRMCMAGICTALVFLCTAYLQFPSHTGYTHVGDGIIYLTACLLPLPYAIFAGAGGALLADCLTGYAVWAPGSVIIKTAAVFFFSSRKSKIICMRNLLALIPAAAFCIGGYYLYEALIVGNWMTPLVGIPGYITQSVLSSILFVFVGILLDKTKGKERLLKGGK